MIIKYLQYILKGIQLVSNAVVAKGQKYVKPMFFSKNRPDSIIAPYIYVFIGMLLFFASIIMFLFLAYIAAKEGIHNAEIVLPTTAGVIATLIAMVGIMIKLYNDGKEHSCNYIEEETIENSEG